MEARICTMCKILKDETEFYQIKNVKKTYNCKACVSIIRKKYFNSKSKLYRQKQLDLNNKSKRRARVFLLQTKKDNKCVVCGERHHACLDFHHREGTIKEFGLCRGASSRSIKKIKEEVLKCDIICSNCHCKLHYKIKSGGKENA